MKTRMTRRGFVQASAVACTTALAGGNALAEESYGEEAQQDTKPKTPVRPPRLEEQLVKDFVIAGHGNLDKVKQMLEQQPRLINATWDWGGGDFETALGGAAHTGHHEIALYLLEKGARIDLFAATMLGNMEVVRAVLSIFPDAINTPGPHGIPLLVHAKMGGAKAEEVAKYLEDILKSKAEPGAKGL